MTRQEVIKRFYADLEAAERYKEKQVDDSRLVFTASFYVGQAVQLKLEQGFRPGHVIAIEISQAALLYLISWPHLRDSSYHRDFELEAVEQQS